MKKTLLTITLIASLIVIAKAQNQFSGYKTGNYTGVNGVFFNPANIADSRYRWDFNLIGINMGVGNDNASFKIKNIISNPNGLQDSLFNGSGKTINALANIDILGPSVLFHINKKTSFAITTRLRTVANISNLDKELAQSIDKQSKSNTYPLGITSNQNQSIAVNGWADIGVSMGRVLSKNPNHFFKAGVTIKYLAGYGNTYVNFDKINGTLNSDANGEYLSSATGSFAIGVGGQSIDSFDGSKASKFNGSGVGADLGLIYEYRPNGTENTNRYQSNYKYKISLAMLDLGSIKYNADPTYTQAYMLNVPAGQKFYTGDLDGKTITEIQDYLKTSPFFTKTASTTSKYSVSLPTTVQMSIDYSINKNFYVDASGQLALKNSTNFKNPSYQNNLTITPRYEGRTLGLFVPLNYNEVTKFNAGVSVRIGSIFLGSGSVLTALLDQSKQADFYFGLRFGSLFSKPTKVKREVMPKR